MAITRSIAGLFQALTGSMSNALLTQRLRGAGSIPTILEMSASAPKHRVGV